MATGWTRVEFRAGFSRKRLARDARSQVAQSNASALTAALPQLQATRPRSNPWVQAIRTSSSKVLTFGLAVLLAATQVSPVAAINNQDDQGINAWREPASDIRFWISTTYPPPNGEVGLGKWTADISWTRTQYNTFDYGTAGITIESRSSDATSNMDIEWHALGTMSALASVGAPASGGFIRCGTTPDCVLTVNSSHTWHNGSVAPPSTKYDARSVLLHEFGHAFGLGHSDASNRGANPVMHSGISRGASRRAFRKDDCASLVFQTQRLAACNLDMDDRGGDEGSGASDPLYFGGWNLNHAWHYQSCSSGGGLSVGTYGCHWRIRPYSGEAAAAIYDLEGSYALAGGQTTASNALRSGDRFRVVAVVGAPSYNPGPADFSICLYLRDESAGANQPHKSGQVCESRTWSGFHNWATVATDWYTLPADARAGDWLRTYTWIEDTGSVYITRWRIERSPNEG